MQFRPDLYVQAAWIVAGTIWAVAAIKAKRTVRIEKRGSRMGHVLPLAVALALIFSSKLRIGPLAWRAFPVSWISGILGLIFTIGGVGFAIWARWFLGGNWSSMVTIKQDHTLIRTGPYAVVRHPIYAGLLLAMLGTAIAFDEFGAFLGVVLALATWLAKARIEESFLLSQFGEAYVQYRQCVKTLIPFVL